MVPRKRSGARKRKVLPTQRRRPRTRRAQKSARERANSTLPVDVPAGGIDEALRKVTETLRHWANTGRYTKVRFKFRGKPLLPDIPLAAVVAAEGLTFY